MKKLHITLLKRGPLSEKEAVVLVYLCEGYTRQEIADKPPKRSISTINRQVESIALKLECHCHAEIVSTAVALNLVKIEMVEQHSLFAQCLICLLIALNASGGNVDMRRGPASPRPIRTARASNRTSRNTQQYPEDGDFGGDINLSRQHDKKRNLFYLETA